MRTLSDLNEGHLDLLKTRFEEIKCYVMTAACEGRPAHEVELGLWRRVLAMGHQALGLFFALQGTGDVGDTLTLSDGRSVRRLEGLHERTYQSVFGSFTLRRTGYGSREGQKVDCVPLDTRLQLPESEFSYLLQDWDQALAVENPYNKVNDVLEKVLGVSQSVDSLERMNRQMAETVSSFQAEKPIPPPEEEGAILVVSADGKGVPIRRERDAPAIVDHDRKRGPKPGRKKQAVVGAVYTVAPHPRTPQDIVEALFRQPHQAHPQTPPARPLPQHKHVRARLSQQGGKDETKATQAIFSWLSDEARKRNPTGDKPLVILLDGQKSLWRASEDFLPDAPRVEILELLHATPRLWDATHLFYPSGSDQALTFVKDRVERILQGQVRSVIRGLRRMGALWKLSPSKKKTLETICTFFQNNQHRMRYNEYLAAGYPIASGVIEGACRHFVKDRMERAGMHWTVEGAQAMLSLRSVALNGDWEAFTQDRIQRQTERLYPHAEAIGIVEWPLPLVA
jgi:hypothetical protein